MAETREIAFFHVKDLFCEVLRAQVLSVSILLSLGYHLCQHGLRWLTTTTTVEPGGKNRHGKGVSCTPHTSALGVGQNLLQGGWRI